MNNTTDAQVTVKELFEKGKRLLKGGDTLGALVCFEKALKIASNIEIESFYAFCIAKERGKFQRAMELLNACLEKEPSNSVHYLNLGRVYLLLNENL